VFVLVRVIVVLFCREISVLEPPFAEFLMQAVVLVVALAMALVRVMASKARLTKRAMQATWAA
jgi:hypothetical protein